MSQAATMLNPKINLVPTPDENQSELLSMACVTQAEIEDYTDDYFIKTRKIIESQGTCEAIYAVFLRKPSLMAPKLAVDWLNAVASEQGFSVEITSNFKEGDLVPTCEPSLFIKGDMAKLVELETIFLQKLGAVSIAALNARDVVLEMPQCPFLAMDARHGAGREMQEQMAYAAKVGSDAAKIINPVAVGFIGTANAATSKAFFGLDSGLGTMPHALIGYAKHDLARRGLEGNALVHAAKLYRQNHPKAKFIVLPDYDGQEITDSIAVCKAFPKEAATGELMFRLDTHGARYLEGLDAAQSRQMIEIYAPHMLAQKLSGREEKYLFGMGVSAAAILFFKQELAKAGFPNIGIVGSSGFNQAKCKMMREAKAPLSMIGTGSYLPERWSDTYATADIIAYDGKMSVKLGREHLIEAYQKRRARKLTAV